MASPDRRGGTVDGYVFPSRNDHADHLSTRHYAKLVDEWETRIGLQRNNYSTHSLRPAKTSVIYQATSNLRAIQILLDHAKMESAVRYLGVQVEDVLNLMERTDV